MTQKKLIQTRIQLYKATPLKLQLVDEIINIIKTTAQHVELTSLSFEKDFLTLKDNLSVRQVEIDPQEIGAVLIHWYPIKSVSLRNDPFCSAYILTEKEIKKIIDKIQSVKDFYDFHTKV
jgi:hypothetical protein